MNLKKDFGDQIIKFRAKKKISQSDLAAKMKIAQQSVARLETGTVNTTLDTVQNAAQALDCTVAVKLKSVPKNRA